MRFLYDLDDLPERRLHCRDSQEVLAIKAFLAGKQKNMCIEYDAPDECKRRYDCLRSYRLLHGLQSVFDLYRRDNRIYILRLKKCLQQKAS